MLNKIKWNNSNRAEQVKAFVTEARRMIAEYGWEDETVMPYGYPEKVTKMVDRLEDIWAYTKWSQETIIAEVNGLARILNKWEAYAIEKANSPIITVRILVGEKAGELTTFPECCAREYIECGLCEAV